MFLLGSKTKIKELINIKYDFKKFRYQLLPLTIYLYKGKKLTVFIYKRDKYPWYIC